MTGRTGATLPWEQLRIIIGPANCPHCLNPRRSRLHWELCEAGR